MAMFNHNAAKYRCCCTGCHSRTGAIIIAVLALVASIVGLIDALVVGYTAVHYGYAMVSVGLSLAISILLLVGILHELPVLMLPAIIIMFIETAIYIVLGVVCIALLLAGIDDDTYTYNGYEYRYGKDTIIIMTVVYFVAVLLQIWFINVLISCYCYLRDKLAAAADTSLPTTTNVETNQAMPVAYSPLYGQQQREHNVYPTPANVYPKV